MIRFGHAKRCYQNLTFWLNLGTTKTYSKILYFVIHKKNPICKILAAFCIYQEIFWTIKFWSCQELLPKGYKPGMPVGMCQQWKCTIVILPITFYGHLFSLEEIHVTWSKFKQPANSGCGNNWWFLTEGFLPGNLLGQKWSEFGW